MSHDRYVVLGLAHARSPWFGDVARWATTGSVPVEFVKCVSPAEVRARLAAGRPFSAALLDARLPAVDRDLLASLRDVGVAPVVVESGLVTRDWAALGAPATLPTTFDRAELLDVLAAHATLIDTVTDRVEAPTAPTADPGPGWRGRLVAVTGRSGSGASTVSIALAQRLADDPRLAGGVMLADLARRAHQAVLHDARDVVPGLQELVEAHRTGQPSFDQVRRLTFDVPSRGYRLVLGLRRPRDWVTVRSRALAAALDGLRGVSRIVVADTDDVLEGEAESGSFDIEDRHLLGRATTTAADLVVVVGTPSVTGLHGLVQHLADLRAHGVDGSRLLAVVNRAPRSARARAELTRVIANLTGARDRPDPHVGPIFVPERRGIDTIHRDVGRLPAVVADPVGRAVLEVLDRRPERIAEPARAEEPVPIRPGSLGHWADDDPTPDPADPDDGSRP